MRNALHASSNNKHAREEIRLLFPDYEFIRSRPIPFHSSIISSLFLYFVMSNFYQLFHVYPAETTNSNSFPTHFEYDLYHLEEDGKILNENTKIGYCFFFFFNEEFMYKFAVHTLTNDSENEESAVFLTLIGKEKETKKFLLQFADNTIHILQSNKTDLFHFINQDIDIVSE